MDTLNVLEFEQTIAELDGTIEKMKLAAGREGRDVDEQIHEVEARRDAYLRQFFAKLSSWDQVLLARHKDRPYTLDYLPAICEDFLELSGDRLFADDGTMIGGFASFDGKPVMVIGQQKGRDLKERQKRNFGYARPEGYRKALRLMKLAEKFRRPVLTFVDTPGADSNPPSEERGISESIARNLREMAGLRTPTVAVIIGEGGSGGALGIAVADRVLMLEHSIYSVIAPEGCASILWRDPSRGADAARAMRVTAKDALEMGLVDEVIPEPLGGAHRDPEATGIAIREAVARHLKELTKLSATRLLSARLEKYRGMGRFRETDDGEGGAPATEDAPGVPAPVNAGG